MYVPRRFIYKGARAHTQTELIRGGGLERASEGQEVQPPVLNARRRQKRQHLHR